MLGFAFVMNLGGGCDKNGAFGHKVRAGGPQRNGADGTTVRESEVETVIAHG